MNKTTATLAKATLALLAATGILGSSNVHAGIDYWTNNGTLSLSNASSYWMTAPTGGSQTNPVSGDAWYFTNTATTTLSNNYPANTEVAGISINSGVNAFTLSGNAITLTGNITNSGTLTTGNGNSITSALIINSSIIITNTGSTGYFTLGGTVTGTGTITYGAANAVNRLVISGGNWSGFTGSLVLQSARVQFVTNVSSTNADYVNNTPTGIYLASGTYSLGSLSGSSQGLIASGGAGNTGVLAVGYNNKSTVWGGNFSSNNNASGSFGLTKMGSGTLSFTGTNTYVGATIVSNGVLALGANGSTGTIANSANITVSGPGVFAINRSNAVSQGTDFTANAITGTGGFAQLGTGTTTLTANNTFTGTTTVSAGTLRLASNASLASTNYVVNGVLDLSQQSASLNIGKGLSGSGTVSGQGVTAPSGSTITPGNIGSSIGTLTLSSLILNGGASVNVGISDATGTAGVGYNSITTGTLDLSGVSSNNRVNINLWSLSSSNAASGNASNFSFANNSSWTLVNYTTFNGTFNSSLFSINTEATNGTTGFGNTTTGGTFSVVQTNSSIVILYTGGVPPNIWTNGAGNLNAISLLTTTNLSFAGPGGFVNNNAASSLPGIVFTSESRGSYNLGGNGLSLGSNGVLNASTGAQTVSLPMTLNSASVFNANSGNLAVSGNVTNAGNQLTVTGSSNTLITGALSGSGNLVKNGSGTLTLSGNNSYSGGTALNSGTIAISGDSALGTSSLTNRGNNALAAAASANVSNDLLLSNGVLTVNDNGNALGLNGNVSGDGSLTKTGAGTLTLAGSNSYTGATVVNSGTLRSGNANALGSSPLTVNSNATIDLGGNSLAVSTITGAGRVSAGNGAVTLTLGSVGTGTSTFAGSLVDGGGSLALVKTNTGTTVLSGVHTASGGATVASGTLVLTNGSSFASGIRTLTGGILRASSSTLGGGVNIGGNGSTTNNSAGSANFVASGSTLNGAVVINGPASGLTPYLNPNSPANSVGTNYGYAIFSNGVTATNLTVNGRLDIESGIYSLSGITGASNGQTNYVGGGSGMIFYKSATSNSLGFVGGSAFAGFHLAPNAQVSLTQSGQGTTYFGSFGQGGGNTAATIGVNSRATFDGGNWAVGQFGQNNSFNIAAGNYTLTNRANIVVGGNTNAGSAGYSHGFFKIDSGSMTFNGDTAESGGGLAALTNTLGFNVGQDGNLLINGRLQLGPNASGGFAVSSSYLTVNGGSAIITNALAMGNAKGSAPADYITNSSIAVTVNSGTLDVGSGGITVGYNSTNAVVVDQRSTLTLNGGKIVSRGGIGAPTAVNSNSTITSSFVWNGGQLSASSITANNGNWNGSDSSIVGGTLSNTNGTLSPGDENVSGLTTITGSYVQSGGNSRLSLDLGGINKATSFTNAQINGGYYDALNISGGGSAVFSNTTIALNPDWYDLGYGVNQLQLVSGASSLKVTNVTYAWADGTFGNTASSSNNAISITVTNNGTSLLANVSFNMWSNGLGNWGSGGTNVWTRGLNPNSTSDFAAFGTNANATLDQNATLYALSFLGASNVVSGTNGAALTFDSGKGIGAIINNSSTGSNNLGANIALNDNLRIIGSGYLNISGNITGSDKFSVTAAGTAAGNNSSVVGLTGSNSYSGPTVVNSGALQTTYNPNTTISNASGTTLIAILGGVAGWDNPALVSQASKMSNATLSFDATLSAPYTVDQSIFTNGASSLTLGTYGSGTVSLASNGDYSSVYRLNANGGTFDLGGNSVTNYGATFNAGLIANGTIVANTTTKIDGTNSIVRNAFYVGNGTATVAATLSGNAGFTNQGGFITLTGSNNYSGATVVTGGTLKTVLNPLSSYVTTNGNTTLIATIVGPNGNWTPELLAGIAGQMTNSTLGIDGNITLGNITNNKAGITLAAYNGTVSLVASNVNSGISKVSVNGGVLNLGGASLDLTGVNLSEGSLTNGSIVNSGAYTANISNSVFVDASLGGTGTLTKSGDGTLTITGNNSYGRTILSGGTIFAGSSTALGSGSLTVNGGLLDLGSYTLTPAGSVSLTGGVITKGALAAGLVFTGSTNASVDSVIADAPSAASSLAINGNGTLTLSSSNSFTGGTVLTKGTLLASASALNNGALTISGGLLDLQSTLFKGDVTMTGGTINNGTLSNNSEFAGLSGGIVNASLVGSARLLKTGPGTLVLNGTNSYTGETILDSGVLQTTWNTSYTSVNSYLTPTPGVTLIASAGKVNPWTAEQVSAVAYNMINSTIGVDASGSDASFSVSNIINANGGVTLANYGTGTLALAPSGDFSGLSQLSLNGGTIDLGGGTFTPTGAYGTNLFLGNGVLTNGVVNASASIFSTVGTSNSSIAAVDLRGSASLTKWGAGTLILAGNNTFSGGVAVNNGVILAASSNALGSGGVSLAGNGILNLGGYLLKSDEKPLSMSGGVLTNGAVTAENSLTNLSGGTIAVPISGSASIVKGGSGTLTLTSSNSYSGGTFVNSGGLVIADASALGSGSVSVSGGSLNLGGSSWNLDLGRISMGGGTISNGTLSSDRSFDALTNGTVAANLTGSGTVSVRSGSLTLSGSNSYSGGSYINGGALVLGSTNANGSGPVVVRGGALDLGGLAFNVSTLNATLTSGTIRNGTITSSGNFDTLTSGSGTISAALAGSGSLTVGSSTTLTLAGANDNWSGAGYLNGGKLLLGNAAALGSGGLNVRAASVLSASTNVTAVGAIRVSNGVTLSVDANGKALGLSGAVSGDGSLLVSNSVTGGSVTLSAYNNDIKGGITVAAGALNIASGSTVSSPVTVNSSFKQFSFSPKPGSNVLTVAGGASNLVVGQSVSGSYIPAGSVITAIDGNSVTISASFAPTAPTNVYGGISFNGAVASGVVTNSGTVGDVTVNSAASLTAPNFYNRGTVAGRLNVAGPANGSAAYVFGNSSSATPVYSGYAALDSGSVVTNAVIDGRLDINGSSALTASGISSSTNRYTSGGPGVTTNASWGSGMIVNNNSFSGTNGLGYTGNVLSFEAGSSFSMLQKGASNGSTTYLTLAQNGAGTVSIAGYGYNQNAVNSLYTFANGNWRLGMLGQNNSNAGDAGTNVIEGNAAVSIVSDATRSSGTWVVNRGSLTFTSLVAEGSLYENNSLNVTVNGTGTLTASNGYILGSYSSLRSTNGAAADHVLNINGGTARITGSLSLGAAVNSTNENSIVTLNSGSLNVTGNLNMGSPSLTQINQNNTFTFGGGQLTVGGAISASSNSASSQANTFNWVDGTLNVRTVDATSSKWTGGNISGGALNQTAGTLAISSNGTTILGDYNLNNGTVSLSIGNGALAVSGTANLVGGNVEFGAPNYFALYKAGSGTASLISAGTGLNTNGVIFTWLDNEFGSVRQGLNNQVALSIVSGRTNLDAVTSVNTYAGGSWNNANSWTRGIVPNGQDYFALIGSSNNVTINSAAKVSDLRLGDNNTFSGSGTLTLTPWSSVNSNAAASVALAANSTNTISAPLALDGNAAVLGTKGSVLNITGGLSGNGTITFNTGSFTLSGDSHSGGTVLTNGNLYAGFNSNTPVITVASNSVDYGASLILPVASQVAGDNWSASNIAAQAARMTNSSLQIDTTGTNFTIDRNGLTNAGQVLALSSYGTGTLTLSNGVTSLAGVAKIQLNGNGGAFDLGGNTLTLSGASNTTTVDVYAGTLQNGTVSSAGLFRNNVWGTNETRITANLAGTGSYSKGGDSTSYLSGSNSFTGGVSVTRGTLVAQGIKSLGDGAVSVTGSNTTTGTLNLGGNSFTVPGDFSMSAGVITNGTLTAPNYNLSGGNVGSALGAGIANVTGLSSNVVTVTGSLAAANVNISSNGTLLTASTSALSSSASVNFSGTSGQVNTLDLGGQSLSIRSLNSTGLAAARVVDSTGGAALTLTGNSSFGGTLAHAGATTIAKDAVLDLGTTGKITGVVNVTGGSLLLGGVNQLNPAADLNLGGKLGLGQGLVSQNIANLTLTANSVIDFSGLRGTSLTISGNFTTGGNSLSIYNWQDGDKITLSTQGSFIGDLSSIKFYSGLTDSSLINLTTGFIGNGTDIVPVPEPGVVITGFLMVAWMLFAGRRRIAGLLNRRMA